VGYAFRLLPCRDSGLNSSTVAAQRADDQIKAGEARIEPFCSGSPVYDDVDGLGSVERPV
jgi:hypothetical protein